MQEWQDYLMPAQKRNAHAKRSNARLSEADGAMLEAA
jgi:hypothetical protein